MVVEICLLLATSGVLLAASIIDVHRRIIPNELVIALLVLWICWLLAQLLLRGRLAGLAFAERGFQGLFLMIALLIAFAAAYERLRGEASFGGGDIKLLSVLGLYLGPQLSLVNLAVACLVSALVFGIQGKKNFAFGPFISFPAACLLAISLV